MEKEIAEIVYREIQRRFLGAKVFLRPGQDENTKEIKVVGVSEFEIEKIIIESRFKTKEENRTEEKKFMAEEVKSTTIQLSLDSVLNPISQGLEGKISAAKKEISDQIVTLKNIEIKSLQEKNAELEKKIKILEEKICNAKIVFPDSAKS